MNEELKIGFITGALVVFSLAYLLLLYLYLLFSSYECNGYILFTSDIAKNNLDESCEVLKLHNLVSFFTSPTYVLLTE